MKYREFAIRVRVPLDGRAEVKVKELLEELTQSLEGFSFVHDAEVHVEVTSEDRE